MVCASWVVDGNSRTVSRYRAFLTSYKRQRRTWRLRDSSHRCLGMSATVSECTGILTSRLRLMSVFHGIQVTSMLCSCSIQTKSTRKRRRSLIAWSREPSTLTEPVRPSFTGARWFNSDSRDPGTGEHGVGIGKRKYLYNELGESTVEFMKTLKLKIDPLNLFNPGKVRTFSGIEPGVD